MSESWNPGKGSGEHTRGAADFQRGVAAHQRRPCRETGEQNPPTLLFHLREVSCLAFSLTKPSRSQRARHPTGVVRLGQPPGAKSRGQGGLRVDLQRLMKSVQHRRILRQNQRQLGCYLKKKRKIKDHENLSTCSTVFPEKLKASLTKYSPTWTGRMHISRGANP